MTDNDLLIPHNGCKPAWLEDDARIGFVQNFNLWPAATMLWTSPVEDYLLSADHWAAPVLRLRQQTGENWTPWNPRLQGDGPPMAWPGNSKVFWLNGSITKLVNWPEGTSAIIGYIATEPAKLDPPAPFITGKSDPINHWDDFKLGTLESAPGDGEVTQADRVAAGPYAGCLSDMQDIFDGKADDLPVVQAFKDHRIQSTAALEAKLAKVRDYLADGHVGKAIYEIDRKDGQP